ncbi:MAG: polyprenyl synthetase family protein [Ruminococcaceae bacterium]|nr:polyprenyl synthetase family protein [Oscillospiraceae bacterium]
MNAALLNYLKESGEAILSYYKENPPYALTPAELFEGTFVYFERGGKRLRPAICRLAAGALGGKEAEKAATPCALALELYHNWTLIHDDMIDHDDTRRGKSAVHKLITDAFADFGAKKAAEYGFDAALLAGDALHSASVAYLSKLSDTGFVPPAVTLKILSLLEGKYGPFLISGETIDTKNGVLYGQGAFDNLTTDEVTYMMAGKTGALFAISALSGALIGSRQTDETLESCAALATFAELCGLAFQLQDDILGVTSTEKTLGKPIGSDIREGKPTVLLLTAYKNAAEEEKAFLRRVVGSSKSEDEICKARSILMERGLEETRALAVDYLAQAEKALAVLPDSSYKQLLEEWRSFMLNREM